ncbi:MAG: hypothetical protein ACXW4M_06815 [Anaerolineales bacterium]
MDMPNEKKPMLHADYWRETFFLPPLKMILSAFDRESRQNESTKNDPEKQGDPDEKTVTKLIEKLSEKDE